MSSREVKFAILEIDNEELNTPTEYEALSEDIYYDAGKTDTVKSKIDTIQEGYGVFFKNQLTQDLTIPGGRTLVVMDGIDLNDFELCIEGGLEILT